MKAKRTAPLKVLCVFGTRPEAIKMAPVVRSLRKRPADFTTCVVVTAQHRKMLDQVMELFHIQSDHDLDIMVQNQTLEYVVTQVLTKLPPILEEGSPRSGAGARRHRNDIVRGRARRVLSENSRGPCRSRPAVL